MDWQSIQPFFTWLAEHPAWSGLIVFLIAFTESLFVVGIIVPGTILMFGVGTLVGAGVLGLQETMLIAFLGAVAGDGLSYWIGLHYHKQFLLMWPLKNNPHHIERGKAYFEKHGGKSVLFGRFVGPVRPFIPAIAGMMEMPAKYFFTINVISAAIWSPFYLLPGIVFGSSINLASVVGARLIVLLLFVAACLLCVAWLVRKLAIFIPSKVLFFLFGSVLLFNVTYWATQYYSQDFHELSTIEKAVSFQEWSDGSLHKLSSERIDIFGNTHQTLNIQWLGEVSHIEAVLLSSDWKRAVRANYQTTLYWLKPNVNLQELPRIAQTHTGQTEVLNMVKHQEEGKFASVIQLWPSTYVVGKKRLPMWVGSITRQSISPLMQWFPYVTVESILVDELIDFKKRLNEKNLVTHSNIGNEVLLISGGENEE